MSVLNFKNKWVLITGASSGLGREMARYLAQYEGANLIIVARRKNRLLDLKNELEKKFKVKVKPLKIDLSTDYGSKILYQKALQIGEIYALINNAGITYYGETLQKPFNYYRKLFNVNLRSVVNNTILFLTYFIDRKRGAILNITSGIAFFSAPYQNIYAATKHAIFTFTEALAYEYKNKGITICSFAPGGMDTEMIVYSGLKKKFGQKNLFYMNAKRAARLAIRAFKKKKLIIIPGFLNKLTIYLSRLIPRRLITAAAAAIYNPNTIKK